MSDNKKKISAWIPCDLLEKVLQSGYRNYTDAVVTGLMLIVNQTKVRQSQAESDLAKSIELTQVRATLEGLEKLCIEKDRRSKELQAQLRAIDDKQEVRILEFQEQIAVKDEQLRAKDTQLEKLAETMQAQAIHIQTLIQENNRLNVKLLPENSKKRWWRFW